MRAVAQRRAPGGIYGPELVVSIVVPLPLPLPAMTTIFAFLRRPSKKSACNLQNGSNITLKNLITKEEALQASPRPLTLVQGVSQSANALGMSAYAAMIGSARTKYMYCHATPVANVTALFVS